MEPAVSPIPVSNAFPPVGLFGSVMGIAGLGLVLRETAPRWLSEPFIFAGVALFIFLAAAYLLKIARARAAVREEFFNPATLGFCATLPLAIVLVAGGLAPYSRMLADMAWWSGVALLLGFQVWALLRWLGGGIDLALVNGGWMIMLIGGIVVPAVGLPLGHPEMSRFLFGVGAAATPFVMGLVFYRTVVGPVLPEPMRPTWFIFLVPPSLIYANGLAITAAPPGPFLSAAFYFALVLAVALLVLARGFLRWPYSPAWWAFTFPLDALAYAASRHSRVQPTPLWDAVARVTLAVAFAFVLIVSARALWHHARRPAVSTATQSGPRAG